MRSQSPIAVVAAMVLAGGVALAQVAKPYGAASPQEAVAALAKAGAANDMLAALPVISPDGLKVVANEGVTGLLMVLAFSDPDDGMPGSTKPTKTELDAKRKQYAAAKDLAARTLKPYGLDALMGKPVLAPDTQKSLDAALDKADKVALITSLYGALVKLGPMLGMKEDPKPTPLVEIGTVTGYKITGDKATAQNGAETLAFTRIDGRWYIEPPSSKSSGTGGSGPQQAAAPRAAAAGNQPEVVIGGVQIARVTVPSNDFSARPFQADNGTTLLLWVKMPAGQGLIEIDARASVLQSVADDKGSNIGGKFGSFPDEFDDASGGTIKIESSGFAAPGATSLVAEGTLAMTVATGTRKTRVPNVRIQDDAKFTFGKTPIAVAQVTAQEDAQTFILKLPRQVMNEIKEVRFLDAKGQVIEGRRSGSGYMNDAAEMSFSVKTAAKTLTLEFEAWQGLKTIKVPFKVKAGLGLD